MDLFKTITAHHGAMRLPLYAVTATAAARVDTPVFLMLHWHGFRRETPVRLPGVALPPRPVAGSAVQIDDHWDSVAAVDQAMLDAAWQLGAWDVERVTHRPWQRLGAPAGEALACRRAFGDYPDADEGQETVIAQAPDRSAMMEMAARRGYIRWMFRPRKAGLWAELDDEDSTVEQAAAARCLAPSAHAPAWTGVAPATCTAWDISIASSFRIHTDTKRRFGRVLKRRTGIPKSLSAAPHQPAADAFGPAPHGARARAHRFPFR